MTITRPPSRGAGVVLAPRCARCGTEAELGRCPGECRRALCVACYDADQGGICWEPLLAQRNEAIRALRGMPVPEIAERFGLSVMTIYRAMR